MNYDKYLLLICNELSCIDHGNQLLIITNAMNVIKIQQPLHFNVFLHGYFLQCRVVLSLDIIHVKTTLITNLVLFPEPQGKAIALIYK